MSRKLASLAGVAAVAAAVSTGAASPAPGSSSSALPIRPGVSIGSLRLGMTAAQVRRILGRPHVLVRRDNAGFGVRYVEYQWDLGSWRVGFRGRGSEQRAVRISTTLMTHRTPERVGVGTNVRVLARRYGSRLSCVYRGYLTDGGNWLVLRRPQGGMTAFAIVKVNGLGYRPRVPPIVGEVLVQRAWATGGTAPCDSDWRTWRW